jgi:hypothetical protein
VKYTKGENAGLRQRIDKLEKSRRVRKIQNKREKQSATGWQEIGRDLTY